MVCIGDPTQWGEWVALHQGCEQLQRVSRSQPCLGLHCGLHG